MAYTELKEKLEKLLTEDLSNRSTLQDARRNLFLNSEGAKVQQQLISEKQGEISSLNLLVEKKKTILQLKDDQINIIREKTKELEEKLATIETTFSTERNILIEKITALEQKAASSVTDESKLTALSLQNEEFSAKIRELVAHIDTQNSKIETINATAIAKSEIVNQTHLVEEKNPDINRLQEKSDLLFESEQQLKVLVSAQNGEIETLTKQANTFKKQLEDISFGWQHQQEQLLMDNANLLAEMALVKEASISDTTETTPVVSEELNTIKAEKEVLAATNATLLAELTQLKSAGPQSHTVTEPITDEKIADIISEKEHLATELAAITHELNVVTQSREEKIMSLQNEIGTLQNQLVSLSNNLNQETEQKNLIGTQVEQLTNIVTEKEQQLTTISNNKADEEFVDKLMQQINLLNDQKHSFETMYHDSEAELSLTKANLATLTQLVDGQKNSISDLEETNKHVKLAQTLVLQVNDKTEAKQAINELVREIDRCIALLSE